MFTASPHSVFTQSHTVAPPQPDEDFGLKVVRGELIADTSELSKQVEELNNDLIKEIFIHITCKASLWLKFRDRTFKHFLFSSALEFYRSHIVDLDSFFDDIRSIEALVVDLDSAFDDIPSSYILLFEGGVFS
ncbi:hypothetical protein QVD17_18083 [Tagetes erecta]|uniref:Uncharacterized protein n=1 Tax=Tagetes erecta TaxID=13708 RepID=A0AAD8KJZ6_TARER|nr:hypothetical protein QVD17_38771 [Tagetes erecta]KAK1422796.1 hypothetical protein QVD17_18083 [Tagetes erecta]